MKRNKNAHNTDEKPLYKRKRVWLGAVLAVGILGNLLPEVETEDSTVEQSPAVEVAAETTPETKETAAKPTKSATKEAEQLSLADEVNAYLGDRRIHGQGVKDGYYTVETDFGRFIGPEFCEEESIDLAQLISEHPEYEAIGAEGVKVVYISGVTDAYGNSADETVMYIAYSNETISRINFDNFDLDNVVAVADDYFRMASFK